MTSTNATSKARRKLVIGNRNYSSWSLRPWLLLRKLGLDFELVVVPLYEPGYKQKLLAFSPAGLVPIYIEGELVIWDSLAIGEYLAEGHDGLWPQSSATRASARALSCEMHAGFRTLRQRMPMNCRAQGRRCEMNADLAADIARIQQIWTACRTQCDASTGPWLYGQFGIIDAMFAPVASRFRTYGIACEGPAGDYLETVLSDAAMVEWYEHAAQETEVISSCELGTAS